MFRKPPLKTYQRKAGGASTTFVRSLIAREDISDDKELQPQEFLAFRDSDKSLEYDPFDTTFDRLARNAKMPPIPQNPAGESYSDDSSSSLSDKEDAEPLPEPLPLINPKASTIRRNNKKQKTSEEVSTLRMRQTTKRGRGLRNDSSVDENMEPNSKYQKLEKRNKNDFKKTKKALARKNRRAAKKSVVANSEDGPNNFDASESLRYCRVSLTRVNVSLDKSEQDSTSKNKSTNGEKIAEVLVEAGPERGEKHDEFVKNGPKEKLTSEFKSPTVLLTRLNVPQSRFSVSNKSWLNSTPIDRRTTRPKSLYRFSPIATSTETTDRTEDRSYDVHRLSTGKLTINSKDLTPQNSRKRPNHSEQQDGNSTKNRPGLLSDSPDPQPSGLMFDDTEIPNEIADSLVENENKNEMEASSAGPLLGFTRVSLGNSLEAPVLRVVLAPIGNLNDVTDASSASPFKGFGQSTDPGSLKLTIDQAGASSEDRSPDKTGSDLSAPKINITDVADASSFNGLATQQENDSKTTKNRSSLKKRSKHRHSRFSISRKRSLKKSDKSSRSDSQESLEDADKRHWMRFIKSPLKSPVRSAKERRTMLKDTVSGLENIFQRSAQKRIERLSQSAKKQLNDSDGSAEYSLNVSQCSSKENAKDTSEKLNSDDEWATISDLPEVNSMTSRTSIVHLSSAEETAPRDDIEIFVDADDNSSRRKFIGDESSSFEVEEDTGIDGISEIEGRGNDDTYDDKFVNESSIRRKFNGEESSIFEDPRRSSIQPVVLLTRLKVPVRKSRQTLSVDNAGISPNRSATSFSESIEMIQQLSSDEENPKESTSDSETSSEPMECSSEEEDASQKSQDDMESSEDEEESAGNTLEIEESAVAETSARDSSRRLSITEDKRSLKRIDDKTNGKKSLEAAKLSVKMTPQLDKHSLEYNSIQPVVLLNRLHDPIRITDRRKKYRDWGLSAITENLAEKNIDDEPECLETAEVENRRTKNFGEKLKEDIWEKPQIQLSGGAKTVSLEITDVDVSVDDHESTKEKIVFLKPGKSWSRSLSLFRQVHSQDDIDALAVGKGKKWRQSVQSILAMQPHGVIQSCFKKNEDNKEPWSCYGNRGSAAAWIPGGSQPVYADTSRVFSQTSIRSSSPASRFVRRVSIRVVPDGKNCERYEDSPFLEAYGITSGENRKTIDKTSTLIAPRKTLVYNVQLPDVTLDKIPKRLTGVTSRDVVLAQCDQESSLPFEECFPDSYLQHCRKIGEGVFGEVFLYEKGTARNVIKIIPIEGELKVNGERQKKFDEILSEIVIAKELNNLRFAESNKTSSFVEVKSIKCLYGKYPEKLIDLWKLYDDEKNSENDCPDMFDANQLYIVLELGHGGQDLEAFVFQNSTEAHALFVQTALALAVAEESLEFEHRDLHWGNVLISRTEDSQIDYKLRNKDIRVASKGVKCSVIDFTLSRMSYQGCCIFNDLSLDDDLFAAQGEYQFEIYRLMRQKVENNWQTFEPFTNVLWLHYTLDKMITAVRYRRTGTKLHKAGIAKLTQLKNEILRYCSAFDFVTNCDSMTRLQGSRSSVSTIASSD